MCVQVCQREDSVVSVRVVSCEGVRILIPVLQNMWHVCGGRLCDYDVREREREKTTIREAQIITGACSLHLKFLVKTAS